MKIALALLDYFGARYLPKYRSRLVTDPEEATRLGVKVGTTIQEREQAFPFGERPY